MAAGTSYQDETIKILKEAEPESNDAVILEQIFNHLLELKAGVGSAVDFSVHGFISCWLIVQTIIRSSKKCKFRLKKAWTGLYCKKEIEKLYDIPAQHQVLIINEHVVSDQQTLDGFNIKPAGQIIYVFLTKKKINYVESEIKISDIVPPRDVEMGDDEGGAAARIESDGSSGEGTSVDSPRRPSSAQSSNRNSRNRRKKKNRKR